MNSEFDWLAANPIKPYRINKVFDKGVGFDNSCPCSSRLSSVVLPIGDIYVNLIKCPYGPAHALIEKHETTLYYGPCSMKLNKARKSRKVFRGVSSLKEENKKEVKRWS